MANTRHRTTVVLLVMVIFVLLLLLLQSMSQTRSVLQKFHFGTNKDSDAARSSSGPERGQRKFIFHPRPGHGADVMMLHRLLKQDPVEYKCLDDVRIVHRNYCRDNDFAVKPPCLVYSFGIDNDFRFDDFFGNLGCEVFSFDPSMKEKDHRRSPQVMFYKMGIGAVDSDNFEPALDNYVHTKAAWKIRTLDSLTKMLNHTERTIDVLKLDIECYEWDVVRNLLDSGILVRQVKQLLVEWHVSNKCPFIEEYQDLISVLLDLNQAGFKTFNKIQGQPNPEDLEAFRIKNEMGYVNTGSEKTKKGGGKAFKSDFIYKG